jgi:hypothetical protein
VVLPDTSVRLVRFTPSLASTGHPAGISAAPQPGIGYICAAGAKIGLSILLLRIYGLVGMAVATLIPTLALSFGSIFPYLIRVLRVSVLELLKQVLVPVLALALLMIVYLYGIARATEPSGLFSTAGIAMSGLALYSFIYISCFAGKAEREFLRNLLAKATGVVSWGRALLTQKRTWCEIERILIKPAFTG